MAVDKLTLSGSTNGRAIPVAANASPGTTIHTGPSVDTSYDEIWLYVCNPGSQVKVTLEWGGTTSPDDLIEYNFFSGGPRPETGLYLFVPGLILRGNATPLVIRAFHQPVDPPYDNPSIYGFVNRIS